MYMYICTISFVFKIRPGPINNITRHSQIRSSAAREGSKDKTAAQTGKRAWKGGGKGGRQGREKGSE